MTKLERLKTKKNAKVVNKVNTIISAGKDPKKHEINL